MRKRNNTDRMQCKTKYFNKAKKNDRKRKLKRDKKRNPNNHHRRKADLGIPNSAPFKIQILAEAQAFKDGEARKEKFIKDQAKKLKVLMEDARESAKRKLPVEPEVHIMDEAKKPRMEPSSAESEVESDEVLFASTLDRCKNPRKEDQADIRFLEQKEEPTAYAFVNDVVSQADIILQVLDARDPQGTRCKPLEDYIANDPTKRLVFLVNKADLVPKANLLDWLKVLRTAAPAVPFIGAAQQKKTTTSRQKIQRSTVKGMMTSDVVGLDVLVELLRNFVPREKDFGMSVGVVGLPNVGKSSVMKTIQRMKMCEDKALTSGSVGSLPEVSLGRTKKLFLITRPGVVLPEMDGDQSLHAVRGVLAVADLVDPCEAARAVWERCEPRKLGLTYGIREPESFDQLITALGEKSKNFKFTGKYERDQVSQDLVYDWNHGYLRHFAIAPKVDTTNTKIGVTNQHLRRNAILTDKIDLFERHFTSHVTSADAMNCESLGEVEQCNSLGMELGTDEEETEAIESDDKEETEATESDVEEETEAIESDEEEETEQLGSDGEVLQNSDDE